MSAHFKVGDKVRIREDLASLEDDIRYGLSLEMKEMAGTLQTIKEVQENNYPPERPLEDGCLYLLEGDECLWTWSSEAFQKAPYFSVGDKITIRPDLEACGTEKIKYGVTRDMAECRRKTFTISDILEDAYPSTQPCEDGCKYHLKEDPELYSWSSGMFVINNLKTTKENENQLQRKEAVVSRGDECTGRTICCGRVKAAIVSGHLSYKALSGK